MTVLIHNHNLTLIYVYFQTPPFTHPAKSLYQSSKTLQIRHTKPNHPHIIGRAPSTHLHHSTPFPVTPTFNSFITPSIYKLNNQGDITQSCLTPLLILNQSPLTSFILTHASLSSYILLIPFRSLPPTPYITCLLYTSPSPRDS